MPHKFKPGQRIRLIDCPLPDTPIGSEYTVVPQDSRSSSESVCFELDGHVTWRPADYFELVQPVGPVVTETVTKTRIVPGVYDHVYVHTTDYYTKARVTINPRDFTADELDAAAAVLSALAKGLRDA